MIVRNHGPASVLGSISSKNACDWCHTPRAEDVALRQCMGCTIARYCSKECQTAAWPSHKYMCTSRSANKVPPIYSSLGHATLAELAQAAKDWSEVHKLGLFILATVLVEVAGGADIALNQPRAVFFELGPPAFDSGGTPSMTFALKSMGFLHRDALDRRAAPHWSAPATAYRAALAQMLRTASSHPDLVGVVPVSFYFRDSMLAPQTNFPLYRRRGGVGVVDQRMETGLRRLLETCTAGINTGIVLRIPTDASQHVPDLGKLVQEGKSWTWTPYASRARIPMAELWGSYSADGFATYHRMWPYSSLLTNASR